MNAAPRLRKDLKVRNALVKQDKELAASWLDRSKKAPHLIGEKSPLLIWLRRPRM